MSWCDARSIRQNSNNQSKIKPSVAARTTGRRGRDPGRREESEAASRLSAAVARGVEEDKGGQQQRGRTFADEMVAVASGSKSAPLLLIVAVIACCSFLVRNQLHEVQHDGASSSMRGLGRRQLATLVGGGEAYAKDDSPAGQAPFNPRSFAYVVIHYHKVCCEIAPVVARGRFH